MSKNSQQQAAEALVKHAEDTCIVPEAFTHAVPYSSGWTYHHIILFTSGLATLIVIFLSILLIALHMSNWVKRAEQTQIVRIILFPPIFAIFNFFSVWFYNKSWILTSFPELYEAFGLCVKFYFLVVILCPDEHTREAFFASLPELYRRPWKRGQVKPNNRGSLRFLQRTWILVFQLLPTKLILTLLEWILSAIECPLKYDLSTAATIISVISSIVTFQCMIGIIGFDRRLKKELEGHNIIRKFISFKGVILLQTFQNPIFTGLAEKGYFKPTANISVWDFTIGTPSFMTCCEMLIVSAAFWWSFSASEYKGAQFEELERYSVGTAVVDTLNISDILKCSWYFTRLVFGGYGRPLEGKTGMLSKEIDQPPPRYAHSRDLESSRA